MKVTIYHNPRCSKSRATLSLLQDHGIEPEIVEYLNHPPTASDLKQLLEKLGIPARDLVRSTEQTYKDMNLSDGTLSDSALIQAIADNPILMQRPIVVTEDRAAIGRPPEMVLKLL